MFGLVIVAWTGFIASGLSVIGFVVEREVSFLVIAFSTMATGFVFLALDKIVTHLEIIARAVIEQGRIQGRATQARADHGSAPRSMQVHDQTSSAAMPRQDAWSSTTDHTDEAVGASIGARNALLSGHITRSRYGKYVVAGKQFDTLDKAFEHLTA